MEKRVTSWAQENDRLYAQAINTLAEFVIVDFGIETKDDYDDCDENEIDACISEYWKEYLDEELKEALQDRIAIAKIIDKDCLGGGGYEAERDIEIDTHKRIKEIINH
jgi:hypothetical protein